MSDESPVIPNLKGIPEDDEAEPLDAGPLHDEPIGPEEWPEEDDN